MAEERSKRWRKLKARVRRNADRLELEDERALRRLVARLRRAIESEGGTVPSQDKGEENR